MHTDSTLRPTAGFATSLRVQVRLLAASRRFIYFTAALLAVPLIIGFLGAPPAYNFYISGLAALLGGSMWALSVWHGEPPQRRSYHWSMPVARGVQDLARVIAGALYLIAACAVLAAACAVLAVTGGQWALLVALSGHGALASFFAAPLIMYLLTSPVIMWSEYRITRALLVGLIGSGFIVMLGFQGEFPATVEAVLKAVLGDGRFGLAHALATRTVYALTEAAPGAAPAVPLRPWLPVVGLWLAVGLVMSALAARYRPDDLRWLARRSSPAAQGS
jgi:hypothetical protein